MLSSSFFYIFGEGGLKKSNVHTPWQKSDCCVPLWLVILLTYNIFIIQWPENDTKHVQLLAIFKVKTAYIIVACLWYLSIIIIYLIWYQQLHCHAAHYLGIGVNGPCFQLNLLLWTFLLVAALEPLLWHYNSSIIWLSPLFPAADMHWVVLWTLIISFCSTGIHQHNGYNTHTPTTAHHYKKLVEYNDNQCKKLISL